MMALACVPVCTTVGLFAQFGCGLGVCVCVCVCVCVRARACVCPMVGLFAIVGQFLQTRPIIGKKETYYRSN
jgi:hypothetical protein